MHTVHRSTQIHTTVRPSSEHWKHNYGTLRAHTTRHSNTQERQNERTNCEPITHTRHTNFHKFLLFFKKKNFCPFPFAHHLVDIVNLHTKITTEQLAFGHVYGTISVNQMLIDHFTLVANWFSSFSTDIQTLRETVLHLSPCSLSQSQSHSYILTHSPPNA